jgi:stearoyl-CoA desaturase (delta-9 desaturase)
MFINIFMTFANQYRLFYFIILLSVPLSVFVAIQTSIWYLIGSYLWMRITSFLFVQIGMHRYFAHNGFTTDKKRHIFLTLGSILTGNGSPLTWSTHHLHHHRHSDTNLDLHSPVNGIINTTFLWPIRDVSYFENGKQIGITPKRLVKDKLLMFIHQHYFKIWIFIILLSGFIDWKITLFLFLAPAGWSVLHGNIITNFISHWKLPGSYRNFDTNDNSYNNKWIQLLQFGEGLHNNHHHNMRDYNQAVRKDEFDLAAWTIDKFFKVTK